MMKGWLS